ncbi:4'-phosphopantetheinyl transferase family protein [Lacrimispora brassicae]
MKRSFLESYIIILDDDCFDMQDPYLCYLNLERREKIMRYRFDLDKKMSFYGELVIRAVLSQKLHVLPQAIILEVGKNGKPYVKNNPNLYFNLSHTRSAVFCAFSNFGEIGADIELIGRHMPDVLHYIGHPEEVKMMESISEEERVQFFYKIWTRKEAYGKRNGLGICQDLKRINTLVSESDRQFITWKEEQYMCSLCIAQDEFNHKHILTEEMVRVQLLPYL